MTISEKNLIHSANKRLMRKEEKKQQILHFLKEQIWSVPEILADVIKVKSRQTIYETLTQMEQDGLLARHYLKTIAGRKVIWGITSQGQIMAWDPDSNQGPSTNYFEPLRVAETTAHHHLGIQKIRLAAEQKGWFDWVDGNSLKNIEKDSNRPDGLITSPLGYKFAIEYERSFKTIKRYESILCNYLQALKQGQMDMVVWICPDLRSKKRLERIILSIQRVNIKGKSIPVDPAKHHSKLLFSTIEEWPNPT